jgi:hypothetical protein
VLVAGGIQPALAGTFTDSLKAGVNPTYWTVTELNGGTPPFYSTTQSSSGVTFATADDRSGPNSIQLIGLSLNMAAVGGAISGDFSTQVSFQGAQIFGGGLDQIEFHPVFPNGNIWFDSRNYDNVHVWDGSNQDGVTSIESIPGANATSGTFAITRSGNTVSDYFDGQLIASETETAPLTGINFILQNNAGSNDTTAVTYNDFSITGSSVIPAPEPSTVALLGACITGLGMIRRRKAGGVR